MFSNEVTITDSFVYFWLYVLLIYLINVITVKLLSFILIYKLFFLNSLTFFRTRMVQRDCLKDIFFEQIMMVSAI